MSRLLAIDFTPRRERLTATAMGFFALTLVVAGAWIVRAAGAEARITQTETEQAELLRQQAQASASREQAAARVTISADRARAINDAVRRLNLPWDAILAALDAALDAASTPQVALLTLEPDATDGIVHLTGEARSVDAMLSLQHRLQAQGEFASVVLVHHELRSDRPGTPVRFSFDVRWRTRP